MSVIVSEQNIPVAPPVCNCGSSLHDSQCPAFQRFEHKPLDFVGIASGRLVYVGVADRAKFDALQAPCSDSGDMENGRVLTKVVGNHGSNEITVVFQHWIRQKTVMAVVADRRAKEGSPS